MTSDPSDDSQDLQETAADLIADLFHRVGELTAGRWIILAEVITNDGDRALWQLAPPEQKAWDTLGLLEHAKLIEYTAGATP